MQGVVRRVIKKNIREGAKAQGIGRHSEEIVLKNFGKNDLKALSVLLGSKPYFNGNRPNEVDCAVFGFLCMLVYTMPADNYLLKLVQKEYSNLWNFVRRMKEKYWPDWEQCKSKIRPGQYQRPH